MGRLELQSAQGLTQGNPEHDDHIHLGKTGCTAVFGRIHFYLHRVHLKTFRKVLGYIRATRAITVVRVGIYIYIYIGIFTVKVAKPRAGKRA